MNVEGKAQKHSTHAFHKSEQAIVQLHSNIDALRNSMYAKKPTQTTTCLAERVENRTRSKQLAGLPRENSERCNDRDEQQGSNRGSVSSFCPCR
jgi:hypothetical protein